MTQIGNPFPMFYDRRGRPLDGGFIYVGEAGQDPETNPLDVFFDDDHTVLADQPLRTIGGLIVRDGAPAFVFVAGEQYSIRARDADGAEVFYAANANLAALTFQPLDSDLTAIAALTTTDFGRKLLAQASGAALRNYAGIPEALPLAGGKMTGVILQDGAGGYAYAASPSYATGLRIFITANGAADPRTQVGDIWLEEAS